jgi:uncharacterized membrane protein (DUF485 family)
LICVNGIPLVAGNKEASTGPAERVGWSTGKVQGSGMSNSLTKIEQNPNYQELVRRRSSLGWMLSSIMLVIYFGFILLVAYAPKFLGTRIGAGVTTIGIPIGLAVIVLAFVLTGIYVRKANSSYDALIRKIVEANRS